jgi:hypothetical protein
MKRFSLIVTMAIVVSSLTAMPLSAPSNLTAAITHSTPFQAITFRAASRGANAAESPFQLGAARFFRNGTLFYEKTGGAGGGRGFNVAAINLQTGELLQPPQNFDTWGTRSTGTAMNEMVNFLNNLPNQTLIMLAIADEAGLTQDNSCELLNFPSVQSGIQTLEALGSQQIRNYCFRYSWAMVAVKGEGQARQEQLINGAEASAQTSVTLTPPCPVVQAVNPTSGTVGTSVTISGEKLSGITAVRFFNNVPASFIVNSDNQIATTVPVGALTGPLTLSKLNCNDVQTESFTVNALCPTISNICPTSAPVGGTVTISGANLSGANMVRFANNVAANFTLNGDAQIIATVPSGAITGPIIISKAGCNDIQTSPVQVVSPISAPPGPSDISLQGRQLIVRKRKPDGTFEPAAAYLMTGVNWSPASRTTNTTPFDPNNANVRRPEFGNWRTIDIPLMKAMNVNTVRLYINPSLDNSGIAVLDHLYNNGIMVIMTVDDAINDRCRAQEVINFYKNHPAILMWMLGSEWNINRYFGVASSVQDAAQRTQGLAALIKTLDANHPVATSYGELDIAADGVRFADTQNYVVNVCPSIDIWSLNIYRGNTFGNLYSQWASITGKPMFIGEFGTDAFRSSAPINPPQGVVDEAMQAQWDSSLWNDLLANLSAKDASKTVLGGLVFEWSDEWWKVSPAGSQQANGFQLRNAHPDHFANEEYFGVVDIDRNPRQVYRTLTTAFEAAHRLSPEIISANFNGAKKLAISGNRFGNAPRVFINGLEKTEFVTSASDSTIQLKAKKKKLGLVDGNNTLQIIDANGSSSNVFTLRI